MNGFSFSPNERMGRGWMMMMMMGMASLRPLVGNECGHGRLGFSFRLQCVRNLLVGSCASSLGL